MEYADNWPVAHHSILQDDFYKNTPQSFGNIIVRKISMLGKYRKKPAIKRFQEQPNTRYRERDKYRPRETAEKKGRGKGERNGYNHPGVFLRKVRLDRVGRQARSSQQRAHAQNAWGIQILGAEERSRAFTSRRALSPD
jgi:hypothetical protein